MAVLYISFYCNTLFPKRSSIALLWIKTSRFYPCVLVTNMTAFWSWAFIKVSTLQLNEERIWNYSNIIKGITLAREMKVPKPIPPDGIVNGESLWNVLSCLLCIIFYCWTTPILKTLRQFENLVFVIMSNRENIRLFASTSSLTKHKRDKQKCQHRSCPEQNQAFTNIVNLHKRIHNIVNPLILQLLHVLCVCERI